MKTIILTRRAARDLDAWPIDARSSVTAALKEYATSGRGDVKKLTGPDSYRLRVGRYRVLFDENQTIILAIYIGKRETTSYRRQE